MKRLPGDAERHYRTTDHSEEIAKLHSVAEEIEDRQNESLSGWPLSCFKLTTRDRHQPRRLAHGSTVRRVLRRH